MVKTTKYGKAFDILDSNHYLCLDRRPAESRQKDEKT